MPLPSVRFTVRRMTAGVGVLALLLSFAIPVGRFVHGHRRMVDLSRRLDRMVRGLDSRCPRSVSQDVWDTSVNWTQIIGPTNIFSNDVIPFDSRKRLVDALEKRLQGPVGPDRIPWIWDGYASIAKGTSFERYVREYRCHAIGPLLRDALDVSPNGVAPDAWDRAVRETEGAIDAIIGLHWPADTPVAAEEQDRFLGSVAAIMARPVGRAKLLAVWEAIAEAGPSGRSYVEGRIASIRRDLDGMADGR